jgi:uncharacterized protein YhfF
MLLAVGDGGGWIVAEDTAVMEFGWEDDGGLGELLIAETLAGTKTATCGFKVAYTDTELAQIRANVGKVIRVVDHEGVERARIRILDVFETTFGDPDPRLIAGEGAESVQAFQRDHAAAWEATVPGETLTGDAVLVVELFELAG